MYTTTTSTTTSIPESTSVKSTARAVLIRHPVNTFLYSTMYVISEIVVSGAF